MSRTMPKQKPGKSKQAYGTDPKFIFALKRRLGIVRTGFGLDVAATAVNALAPKFWTMRDNALVQSWHCGDKWAWLNPPFGYMVPWVRRAHEQTSMIGSPQCCKRLAMLVPAGVGSNWWANYVDGKAYVLLLNGRLTFVGEENGYIKDCALLLYGEGYSPGYEVWKWQR